MPSKILSVLLRMHALYLKFLYQQLHVQGLKLVEVLRNLYL